MPARYQLARLLAANARWAKDVENAEPSFFQRSVQGQSPHTLWIGCSDSRVPESVISGSKPGDIFVHRNIANQAQLDDQSVQAVITYAVYELNVEHVVVVGHSVCGGVTACVDAAQKDAVPTIPELPAQAPLNQWLRPLTNLAKSLKIEGKTRQEAMQIVVEENVKQQVENICQAETMVKAWKENKNVWVHGFVYDLSSGLLNDLGITKGPGPA